MVDTFKLNSFKLYSYFICSYKVAKIFPIAAVYLLLVTHLVKAQNSNSSNIPPLPPQTPQRKLETLPSLEEILPELPEKKVPENQDRIPNFRNTVFVEKFEIVGSTVFTPEELADFSRHLFRSKTISKSQFSKPNSFVTHSH